MDERLTDSSTVDEQLTQSYGEYPLKIVLVLITLLWVLLVLHYQYNYRQQPSNMYITFKTMAAFPVDDENTQPNRSIIILAWTPFFDYDLARWMNETGLEDCEYRCVATNDRSTLLVAGVVLFHIRDMRSTDLPQFRSPQSLFAFYLHESPPHTGDVLDDIPSDYFNITMTYRLDSDIHAGYGLMKPIDNFTSSEEVWEWEEVERTVENKTKSVLLFVSNCVTESKRELYVRELARYIEVTEFGRCSKKECDAQCAQREIAQHHFYLAFENSVCRDYVTEKLFTRMEKIILPIVLNRSITSKLIPNGSFIAADDFSSPASLAAYLQYLETNKTEYIKYFDWMKVYKKKTNIDYACDLCRFLHKDSKKPHVVQDIKAWWIDNGTCINDYATQLLAQ